MNKMIVANLVHRPIRSLISIVAIAVEVTLILVIVGLSVGILKDSTQRQAGIGADVIVRPPGSSNLAAGGERANGDSLVMIEDSSIASLYAIEAVRLFDHYHFRHNMSQATEASPLTLWRPWYGCVACTTDPADATRVLKVLDSTMSGHPSRCTPQQPP